MQVEAQWEVCRLGRLFTMCMRIISFFRAFFDYVVSSRNQLGLKISTESIACLPSSYTAQKLEIIPDKGPFVRAPSPIFLSPFHRPFQYD